MTPLASSILGQAGRSLGAFLPRLGGALVLLLVGLLVVRLLARLLLHLMRAVGLDRLATRSGVAPVLESAGLGSSLATLIARVFRIALSIVVILATVSLLGLQFLSPALNQAVLALPRLLIAGALVLAGVVLGRAARRRTDRLAYQLDFPVPLGHLAQLTVVAVLGIIAAAEIGISTAVLLVVIGVLIATIAGTFTLAFGLGSREVARALSAGRYVRHDYHVGQDIGFGQVRGRIMRINSTSTTLDAGEGRSIRVPNQLLLENMVTVYPDAPDSVR